jgi:thiosulfate/3-mercaptopyruvate sulfurtransferase
MYTTLIEPAELAAPLARTAGGPSDWAVLDCRFELARPDWGAGAYAAGHIPGALYAHLDRDLSGPVTPSSGRHPLPGVAQLAETFGRWGIDEATQVVAYDQGNGAFAARLWWLLRWLGHPKVAVLNGGFAAWQQAGLPTETTTARRDRAATERPAGVSEGDRAVREGILSGKLPSGGAPRVFTPRPESQPVISTAELERTVAAGELTAGRSVLVDARGPDRFAGENETIDPVAGHIPGARNHAFVRNVDARGRFLPAGELQERWRATLGDAAATQVIAMCGSGVTACHNLLALEVAGLPGARLYAGSWSEWIRDRARPVTR